MGLSVMDYALRYFEMGYRVIPLKPRQKVPAITSWREYQVNMPALTDIQGWFKHPLSNLGIVTGDGVLVVDLDGPGAEAALNAAGVFLPASAPRSSTGKGHHVWLKVREPVPNAVRIAGDAACGVDIRCDGGYVVAPPSIHESGRAYTWITELGELPDAPESLLELMEKTRSNQNKNAVDGWITKALNGAAEGERDDTCTRLAGYFIGRGLPPDVVGKMLHDAFAKKCRPEFPED